VTGLGQGAVWGWGLGGAGWAFEDLAGVPVNVGCGGLICWLGPSNNTEYDTGMSDIKLYQLNADGAKELECRSSGLERTLQRLIEENLETLLGIRFIASEYSTGPRHGGRIDTLGLDENGCPVIIEYKRTMNANVINQGLFYLDWLLDHKAEFTLAVMNSLGKEIADTLEWSNPRLLCIAGDFTKYDIHAVKQMNRNIELIRYAHYGEDLLLLDLVNATTVPTSRKVTAETETKTSSVNESRRFEETIQNASENLKEMFDAFDEFARSLGDDVQIKNLKYYRAYKRLKNFACVELNTNQEKMLIHIKGDTTKVPSNDPFIRNTSNIGHWGTGNIELTIQSTKDLERAEHLIRTSYDAN